MSGRRYDFLDGPDDALIARLTRDGGVAAICRVIARSRAGAHALSVAALSGMSLDAALGGMPPVASVEARAVRVASTLRALSHEAAGISGALHGLPTDERLAGLMLAEADVRAFVVHVAAQAAASGSPNMWEHVRRAAPTARAADSYVRGFKKGGERAACLSALACQASDQGFAEEMAARALTAAPSVASRLSTVSLLLAAAPPCGAPHPARSMSAAVESFRAAAAQCAERTDEMETRQAPDAMRPAA